MNVPIRSLFRRYLWITGLVLSGVSVAMALGVARLAEEFEGARTEQVIHHTLSGMLAPALNISDYAEVHRVLQLSTREDYRIAAYTKAGDLLLSDYTLRPLLEIRDRPTDCNSGLPAKPTGWKSACTEFSWGTLRSLYKKTPLPLSSERVALLVTLMLGVLGGTLAFLRHFLDRSMLSPMESLAASIGRAQDDSGASSLTVPAPEEGGEPEEIGSLRNKFNALLARVQRQLVAERESSRTRAIAEQARQVAHDVASPLGALESVLRQTQLPADRQHLMRSAVDRIRAIVSDLRKTSAPHEVRFEPLLANLSEVVLEKQAQNSAPIEFIYRGFENRESLQVRASSGDLKRVFSNLIGNSIEAGANTIEFDLDELPGHVSLRIKDDGKGLPTAYLERAFEKGVSVGKEGGSGLGLYHAQQCVRSWEGSVALNAEPQGTSVTLHLVHKRGEM